MARNEPFKETAKALALLEKQPNPAPVICYHGEIMWLNGVPTLRHAPTRISNAPDEALKELVKIALDLPYDGRDPSLQGLTQGEAMVINLSRQAASGDATARQEIMDRIMGKATQTNKNINLNGDINELLDQVAKETRTVIIEAPSDRSQQAEDL